MKDSELLESFCRTHGIDLPEGVPALLGRYIEELETWNASAGLVSPRSLERAWEVHVLDSLSALILLDPFAAGRGISILDVGSGAGLPGFILAAARPGWRIALAESSGKKHRFQRHIRRALGLTNILPLQVRLDPDGRAGGKEPPELFDALTARAFSDLGGILRLARPSLKTGGALLALRGPRGSEEAARLDAAGFGFRLADEKTLALPISGAGRALLLYIAAP